MSSNPTPIASSRMRQEAARRLGIEIESLDPSTGYLLELRRGGRRRVLVHGLSPLNDAGASRLAGDKYYTSLVLQRAGFPVPRSTRCLQPGTYPLSDFAEYTGLETARAFAIQEGYPVVVKPNRGSRGRGVAVAADEEELEAAVREVWQGDPMALVLELIPGTDRRLDFLDGEFLYGYDRQPVVLEGDGRSTLRELLASWDRRFTGDDFERRLLQDPLWRRSVVRLGFGLDTPLEKGRRIELSGDILNLNRFCVARYLPDPPQEWIDLGLRIGAALHLRHFGIDFRRRTLDEAAAEAVVLEVNASPSLGQSYEMGYVEETVAAEMRVLEALMGD